MKMQILLTAVATCILSLPVAFAVYMQNNSASTAASSAIVGGQAAQIVADSDAGTVDIIIQGRPAARFDATGLHVHGDLEYGGNLTDTGGTAEGKP